MKLGKGYHLTYCTNIHPAESWEDVFENLQTYAPKIKKQVSPQQQFGLGLYLSDLASQQILSEDHLETFKTWLQENGFYVFTINGFPFGGFHDDVVKDHVYRPDWTINERLHYSQRLFKILAVLLPEEMEGGISTAPVSYKYWFKEDERTSVFKKATLNFLEAVNFLHHLKEETGRIIHLDIEPEPDCMVENTDEVVTFFNEYLIKEGVPYLKTETGLNSEKAEAIIREHLRVCYDICHFAVEFEEPASVVEKLAKQDIKIGKIQISAALKAQSTKQNHKAVKQELKKFAEPSYLHQTVIKDQNGNMQHFRDLPEALQAKTQVNAEWRSHYHVPIFIQDYGTLHSTQSEITKVLRLLQKNHLTSHLEVETYTWEILPEDLKLSISDSITRELQWVIKTFKS